jgi:hypothetical protein
VIVGGWRKLDAKELHNLYSSSDIIRKFIKSKRLRCVENVVRMGDTRETCQILVEEIEGRI